MAQSQRVGSSQTSRSAALLGASPRPVQESQQRFARDEHATSDFARLELARAEDFPQFGFAQTRQPDGITDGIGKRWF
jgi:hypothetical protein